MLLTATLVVCLVTVVVIYLWILNSRYSYFKQRGISTPPYCFFFGHYKTIWSTSLLTRQLETWTRQFGSIYGLFEGTRPLYVVSDVEFLNEVFIKQFSLFHSRRLPFIVQTSRGKKIHLLGATGANWHRQRQVINPTFSSAKLKLMTPLVNGCIEALIKKLSAESEEQEEFNIYMLYKRLTMDVICKCAFGIDTDMQNDIDNEYMQKSEQTVAENLEDNPLIRLGHLLPWLVPILTYIMFGQILFNRFAHKWIRNIEEMPRFWLLKRVQHLIDVRTSSYEKDGERRRIDLLRLMLDAAARSQVKDHTDSGLMSKELHHEEVVANIFLFMIAGYETTATLLAYCTYVLAREPLIQKKLQIEIDLTAENRDENEYDQVHNIVYLDWFIREVLRMFPVAPQAISRVCNTTTTVCGHIIEKGSVIQPDMYTIHYDPDLWGPEDPKVFLPERHSTPRHPIAFMPFGVGPRNCVGRRFALMEIKLCLTRLLRQYSIHPGDQMEAKFKLKDTLFILQPEKLYVKIEKRS